MLSVALGDLYIREGNPFLRHADMFREHLDTTESQERVEYVRRMKKAGNACRKEYDARFDMLDKIVSFSDAFPTKSKRKEKVEHQMIAELSSFNEQRLDVLDALLVQVMDSDHRLGLTLQLDSISLPMVAEAKNLVEARRENFSPKMNMSLKHLLTNPTSIEYLKCFFRRRQMVEGLQFWLEVQKYRQLGGEPLMMEAGARFIYELYIADGGARQVNLSDKDSDPIHKLIGSASGMPTRRGWISSAETMVSSPHPTNSQVNENADKDNTSKNSVSATNRSPNTSKGFLAASNNGASGAENSLDFFSVSGSPAEDAASNPGASPRSASNTTMPTKSPRSYSVTAAAAEAVAAAEAAKNASSTKPASPLLGRAMRASSPTPKESRGSKESLKTSHKEANVKDAPAEKNSSERTTARPRSHSKTPSTPSSPVISSQKAHERSVSPQREGNKDTHDKDTTSEKTSKSEISKSHSKQLSMASSPPSSPQTALARSTSPGKTSPRQSTSPQISSKANALKRRSKKSSRGALPTTPPPPSGENATSSTPASDSIQTTRRTSAPSLTGAINASGTANSHSSSGASSPMPSPRSGSLNNLSNSSSPAETPRSHAVTSTPSQNTTTTSFLEPSPTHTAVKRGANASPPPPLLGLLASNSQNIIYPLTLFDGAAKSIAALLEDNLDGFHTSPYYRQMMMHFRPLRSFQEFVADVGGAKGSAIATAITLTSRKSAPPGTAGTSKMSGGHMGIPIPAYHHHQLGGVSGGVSPSTSSMNSPTAHGAAAKSDSSSIGRHHNHHDDDLYASATVSDDAVQYTTDTLDVYRTVSLPTLTVSCLSPGPVDVLGGCLDGSIIVLKLDKQGVELESSEVVAPGIIEGRVMSMYRHSPTEVFLLTDRGRILLFDLTKKKVTLKLTKGTSFATGFLRIDANRLWVACDKTVQDWQWNSKKKKYIPVTTREMSRAVTSMLRVENSVWIGDELGGLTRLNLSTLQPLSGDRVRVSQSSPVHFIHKSEYSTKLKDFISTTTRVWVASRDGAMNVFETDGTLVQRQDMSVHDLPIIGAANMERHLVLGSEDGSLSVWKPDTLELEERVGKVHKDSISAICCNADQKLLYTAGVDRLIATWQSRRTVHPKGAAPIPHTAVSLTKKASRGGRAKSLIDGMNPLLLAGANKDNTSSANSFGDKHNALSFAQSPKVVQSPISMSSAIHGSSENSSRGNSARNSVESLDELAAQNQDADPFSLAAFTSSTHADNPSQGHSSRHAHSHAHNLSGAQTSPHHHPSSSSLYSTSPPSRSFTVTVDSLLQLSKHPEDGDSMVSNVASHSSHTKALPTSLRFPSHGSSVSPPASPNSDHEAEADSPRRHPSRGRPRHGSSTEQDQLSPSSTNSFSKSLHSARSQGSSTSSNASPPTSPH